MYFLILWGVLAVVYLIHKASSETSCQKRNLQHHSPCLLVCTEPIYFFKGNTKGSNNTQNDSRPSCWHFIISVVFSESPAIYLILFLPLYEFLQHLCHTFQITGLVGALSSWHISSALRQKFIPVQEKHLLFECRITFSFCRR